MLVTLRKRCSRITHAQRERERERGGGGGGGEQAREGGRKGRRGGGRERGTHLQHTYNTVPHHVKQFIMYKPDQVLT